jgi:hypothetical protein
MQNDKLAKMLHDVFGASFQATDTPDGTSIRVEIDGRHEDIHINHRLGKVAVVDEIDRQVRAAMERLSPKAEADPADRMKSLLRECLAVTWSCNGEYSGWTLEEFLQDGPEREGKLLKRIKDAIGNNP